MAAVKKPAAAVARSDLSVFFRAVAGLFEQSRQAGRLYRGEPWLDYDQWTEFGKAAVRAKLVTVAELNGGPQQPFRGSNLSNCVRTAILRTWDRVADARSIDTSAEDFFRQRVAAMQHDEHERMRREAVAAKPPPIRKRRFQEQDDK